ncbi:MAG TPA: hypothetical protein VIY54_04470 [Steroidobacteraceae bacterium]
MPAISEWLQIMLAEIARKRDELQQGREEETKRHERPATGADRRVTDSRKLRSKPDGRDD